MVIALYIQRSRYSREFSTYNMHVAYTILNCWTYPLIPNLNGYQSWLLHVACHFQLSLFERLKRQTSGLIILNLGGEEGGALTVTTMSSCHLTNHLISLWPIAFTSGHLTRQRRSAHVGHGACAVVRVGPSTLESLSNNTKRGYTQTSRRGWHTGFGRMYKEEKVEREKGK